MPKRKHIQPKPTRYAGILFESRMEAKWAVIFDHCQNVFNWEYEPQTFIKRPENWEYTPDFYITGFDRGRKQALYVECKPAPISKEYHDFLLKVHPVMPHNLLLLMSSMFPQNDELYITGILFEKGIANPVSPAKVFRPFDKAVTAAMNYRFDLA